MKFFLLIISFIIFLKADTDSVNTSNFNYGGVIPIEFSYIKTKDDGTLYHIGVGIGGFLEYDSFEIQISTMFIPYTDSDSLFKWNGKKGKYGDTFKLEGAFLYKLNNNWQIGIDYSRYVFATNEGKISDGGSTHGYMSSYGLKFLYDPIGNIVEQRTPLLMLFSLDYLDAQNIIYEERKRYRTYHIKKRYDLSGSKITIGLLKKF